VVCKEFERGPQQVMVKLLQCIYHGKALTLYCSIILFCIKQLATGKYTRWSILPSPDCTRTAPNMNRQGIYMDMKELRPIKEKPELA
jgi:hypothetical protein